ncbi:MAG: N-acyl homoserine lactonase family protein [Hyphomicrobiales bacterium]|nr:N-acyl homoserine lactonase family protein [Hyphomicrobiales bacterium]
MRIHAIRTGSVRVKTAQVTAKGSGLARQAAPLLDDQWTEWLPTYAWAVEHNEGVIVVDTGSAAHLQSLPKWHPYFRFAVQFDIEPEQEIGPQLRSLGIRSRDVRKVVLTHLHIDHDAGLRHFPDSAIFAHSGEIRRASGLRGRILGYLPARWSKWFDPQPLEFEARPLGPFARSRQITSSGDVISVPTPGHTPNHISVVVLDGEKAIFLAGDASYTERHMLDMRIDGVSADETIAMKTLSHIRDLTWHRPTVYLPTRDPQSQRLQTRLVSLV